jgi:hypothetical protein
LLQATIRDYNGRWIWSDTYRGDYSWSYTFATYTGDERALSDKDKNNQPKRTMAAFKRRDLLSWLIYREKRNADQ